MRSIVWMMAYGAVLEALAVATFEIVIKSYLRWVVIRSSTDKAVAVSDG